MDLDSKSVMLFRVFIAQEDFDTVSKAVSKNRATFLQDASYFQHPLKFQRHDRILVPLDNMCYDCPVGINERTGEVGNLCLDRVTPAEGIQQFRIHGVFKEYGSTRPIKTNVNQYNPGTEDFPPENLYEPQWQFHYGDPFLLRPDFNPTNITGQRENEGLRKINVFNLRTGEPLSVPLTKVRLHPNYIFKGSEIRGSQKGLGNSRSQFRSGQLLTVAVLGRRNVRLGGRTTSSLLFCLATGSGVPSWVLENQLEPLDTEFMSSANHSCHWLISDMEDDIRDDIHGLGLQDLSLQVVYANFRNSGNSNTTRTSDLQDQIYQEYDSEQEDGPCSEDDGEDGDIQHRGRLPHTTSRGHSDVGNSRRHGSRDDRVILQRTRQSSVGSEIHELRRAHLDPRGQGVRVDSTPVQSESSNQRGRNPASRSPHYQPYREDQLLHARTQRARSSRLAPPPHHLMFLGDRLQEERERFTGMDIARYSSRERDPEDGELEGEEPLNGIQREGMNRALAYMRSRRGPQARGTEHTNSHCQQEHRRRSPPIGDGY
ncbi:hypothetical protein TWF718_006345 [Orbilia javanica]|uniref:Uncharacterized protein n=1 Tax=Orbilia javanica TaxID=47235 RepID=A0AAN8MW73_9PEZI